jgi:cathepsin B
VFSCSDHHTTGQYPPCGQNEYPTPACPTKCDANSTYATPFAKDAHKFASAYSVSRDPVQIQQELMTNGPVEAAFTVYSDFPTYKSGVYHHVSGSYLGGHAVKILGWGVDAQTKAPYWTVANSWNTDWGEGGFFRILRGSNECGIEGSIVAGKFQA